MDENKDWLEVWKDKSKVYKKKYDDHIKLINDNVSRDERQKSGGSLSFYPWKMYPVFFQVPKILKRVVRKNSQSFTPKEYILLDWMIDEVLGWHWWEYLYQPQVIRDDCNLTKKSFYASLKNLRQKNIIKIVETTKEDKKRKVKYKKGKVNIFTKQKIVLNPFWDTWYIKERDNDVRLDTNQDEIEEQSTVKEMLQELKKCYKK